MSEAGDVGGRISSMAGVVRASAIHTASKHEAASATKLDTLAQRRGDALVRRAIYGALPLSERALKIMFDDPNQFDRIIGDQIALGLMGRRECPLGRGWVLTDRRGWRQAVADNDAAVVSITSERTA